MEVGGGIMFTISIRKILITHNHTLVGSEVVVIIKVTHQKLAIAENCTERKIFILSGWIKSYTFVVKQIFGYFNQTQNHDKNIISNIAEYIST